ISQPRGRFQHEPFPRIAIGGGSDAAQSALRRSDPRISVAVRRVRESVRRCRLVEWAILAARDMHHVTAPDFLYIEARVSDRRNGLNRASFVSIRRGLIGHDPPRPGKEPFQIRDIDIPIAKPDQALHAVFVFDGECPAECYWKLGVSWEVNVD